MLHLLAANNGEAGPGSSQLGGLVRRLKTRRSMIAGKPQCTLPQFVSSSSKIVFFVYV